jgi:hypothetical protein
MAMSIDPRPSRPHPSFRPRHAIDRMQAAVIAALRRPAARRTSPAAIGIQHQTSKERELNSDHELIVLGAGAAGEHSTATSSRTVLRTTEVQAPGAHPDFGNWSHHGRITSDPTLR